MKGRVIFKTDEEIKAEALVSKEPIGFLGGVDPNTGEVLEGDIKGQFVKDKILVFPTGKGSTVGSYVLYQLKKNNVAPKAIINSEAEPIVVVGAIISEIPMIDKIDISSIKTGDSITLKNDTISL
ncbi:hypothetical protein CL614_01150 [archaeon]|nr:hypothetical protein [archaeon]